MKRDLSLIQMTDYISCKDLKGKKKQNRKVIDSYLKNTHKITNGNHTCTHTCAHVHTHTNNIK